MSLFSGRKNGPIRKIENDAGAENPYKVSFLRRLRAVSIGVIISVILTILLGYWLDHH